MAGHVVILVALAWAVSTTQMSHTFKLPIVYHEPRSQRSPSVPSPPNGALSIASFVDHLQEEILLLPRSKRQGGRARTEERRKRKSKGMSFRELIEGEEGSNREQLEVDDFERKLQANIMSMNASRRPVTTLNKHQMEIEEFSKGIENRIKAIQNKQLDLFDSTSLDRWTTNPTPLTQNASNQSLRTPHGHKPRFLSHDQVSGEAKKPAWYQNPGPWWIPATAAKPEDIKWVEKYQFTKSIPGILKVYVPIPKPQA